MNNSKTMSYETPVVKVITVQVEKGFAASGDKISGWEEGGRHNGSFRL